MNNSRFKAAATLAIPATLTTRYQCHVLSCDPDKKEVFSLRKVIGLFTLSSPRHLLKEFQFPFFRKSECLHFLFCNWEHHCTNIRARCAEKEVRTRHMLFWGNLATKAFFLCFFSMTLRLLFFFLPPATEILKSALEFLHSFSLLQFDPTLCLYQTGQCVWSQDKIDQGKFRLRAFSHSFFPSRSNS